MEMIDHKRLTFVSVCERFGRLPRGNIQVQIARLSSLVGVERISRMEL